MSGQLGSSGPPRARVGLAAGCAVALLVSCGCCGLWSALRTGPLRSSAPRPPSTAPSAAPTLPAAVPTVPPAVVAAPAYTVLRETPVEDESKAQLDGRLVIAATSSAAELRAALLDYLERARARAGWARHDRTTRVYAYAYASEADANGTGAGWLAMLSWSAPGDPSIVVASERVEAAALGPVDRGGLSEDERRAVYAELMRADAAALASTETPDEYVAATEANERRVARDRHLPVETVRAIGVEGVANGW